MPFQLSAGVNVTEVDLTTVVPAVATTDAAIAGLFKWGPAGKAMLVVSEDELIKEYAKPDNDNFETWFTAANFLSYANRLYVSRAHRSTGVDLHVTGYTQSGSDYVVVTSNTATGIVAGFEVVPSVSVAAGTTVEAVDATTVSITLSQSTQIDSGNNEFLTAALEILNNERVQLSDGGSGNPLPDGLSAGVDYYIVNKDTDSLQLSLSQGGAPVTFNDNGFTDVTLTRAGDTRITLSGLATSTGAFANEYYDSKFSLNAIANTAPVGTDSLISRHIVKNEDEFESASVNFDSNVHYIAKYPGAAGNSLAVSVCDTASAFSSTVTITNTNISTTTLTLGVGSKTATIEATSLSDEDITVITNQFKVGDLLKFGNTEIGYQYLEVTAIGAPAEVSGNNVATVTFSDNLALSEAVSLSVGETLTRHWKHFTAVQQAPGQSSYVTAQGNTAATDELHVVVTDAKGKFSGVPGTILEIWQGLSRATDAKGLDGETIYYKEVINQSSKYVYVASDRGTAPSATALNVASATSSTAILNLAFSLGKDIAGNESTVALGDVYRAYDVFKSAEDYNISLVLTGKSRGGDNGTQLANYIIDNICERRKDCVSFVSPEKADAVGNFSDITADVVQFRDSMRSTSYSMLDSGYKYQYDKHNDVYRWVPLNGDIAGLCARTDSTRDPWYSPAGFNRGNIKNVVKLAWNPKQGERDTLYSNGVNPVVNFPGQGIILYGDKTLLAKPSAFDRVNVRRLFIVLEKAIAAASQFSLFEFNDAFTRASFVNLVTPFLRDVQARRGITDFIVICDETNNTGEVIDSNEFVGDIYIKPARSINYIQLNFVAVRTGVEFSEIIGNF